MGRRNKTTTPQKNAAASPPQHKTPEKRKTRKAAAAGKENNVAVEKKHFSCHQCRHQHPESEMIWCSNPNCVLKYSFDCLWNNYTEIVPQNKVSTWSCPRCRRFCNCSYCVKFLPLERKIEDLMTENSLLKKKEEHFYAKISSLEEDCQLYKQLLSHFACFKKGEEQDRERLRFESQELEKQIKAARRQAEAEAAEQALRNAELAAAAEAKRKGEFEREAAQDLILQKLEKETEEESSLEEERAAVKELQQVREDRDRLFLRVQELTSQSARYEETIRLTIAKLDNPIKEISALEETCSSQRDQIALLQHQLADANQKLKVQE